MQRLNSKSCYISFLFPLSSFLFALSSFLFPLNFFRIQIGKVASQRVGESSLSHATSAAEVRKQQRSEYASESRAGLDSYSEQERLSRWQMYMTKRPLPTSAERS